MSERDERIDRPVSEEPPAELDQPEGSEEEIGDDVNPSAPSEVQT